MSAPASFIWRDTISVVVPLFNRMRLENCLEKAVYI